MKKILIFIPSLAGGGAERTLVNIIKHIDKSKFTITLVLLKEVSHEYQKNKYLELIEGKCKIIYLNARLSKFSIFSILVELSKCIKREKPDILFSTRYTANVITYIARLLSGKKIPLVVRESTNRTEEGISSLNKNLLNFTYNRATQVIALSKGVSKDLTKNFKINPKKIKVIYNPVDIEEIQKLSSIQLHETLREKDEKVIVSVGRLFEQKDFPTLLRAFKIVSDKVNVKLYILGQGPLLNELESLTKALNLKDKVKFLGFQENPYSYMKAADLFVLPSKFEGFGHVIVEAMTVGTPVIASNCKSGPFEILQDGKYGELFSVGDYEELAETILKLFNNKKIMEDYKEVGFERAKFFAAKNIVREYEGLFSSILQKK